MLSGGFNFIIIIVPLFIIILIMNVYSLIIYPKSQKKQTNKMVKYAKENVSFRQCILDDIIVLRKWIYYGKSDPGLDKYVFFPILRDVVTNELYISNMNETYFANFSFLYESANTLVSKGFNYDIIKDDSTRLKIGDLCKCYINQVVNHKVELKGNDVFINDKKYTYSGNIFESNIAKEYKKKNLIFNIKKGDGILKLVNAKFFNGVIEFY